MKKSFPYLSFCLLCAGLGVCQQNDTAAPQQNAPTPQPANPAQQNTPAPSAKQVVVDSIQVTTTVEPLPFAESDRSVEELLPREMPMGTEVSDEMRR